MPKVTVYVRKDDLEKWRTLKNKAEFLSLALRASSEPLVSLNINAPKKVVKILKDTIDNVCDHGAAKGFCKKSKCKYSMFNPRNK